MSKIFVNWDMALLAAQSLSIYFARKGYLVSCTFSAPVDECQVAVHRKIGEKLRIPKGYIYSERTEKDYPVSFDVKEPFAVTYFRYYTKER